MEITIKLSTERIHQGVWELIKKRLVDTGKVDFREGKTIEDFKANIADSVNEEFDIEEFKNVERDIIEDLYDEICDGLVMYIGKGEDK